MAQHTITLTDIQEANLAQAVQLEYDRRTANVPRSQPVPEKPTNTQAITQVMEGWIEGRAKQYRQQQLEQHRAKLERYLDLSTEERAKVDALLTGGR